MISAWPVYDGALDYPAEEKRMAQVMDAIRAIRNLRTQMNVPPSKRAALTVVCGDPAVYEGTGVYFEKLAGASGVTVQTDKAGIPENAVNAVVGGAELFIPMDELVDREKELARLTKEKEHLENEIRRVEGKLQNEGFVSKAPQQVVQAEREKAEKYRGMLEKIADSLAKLG